MRMINADELIVMEYGGIKFVPVEFINGAPTIDAVPVVRCKDCKFYRLWRSEYCCQGFTADPYEYLYTGPDDFCSSGERRTDGSD